jgi:adenylyltransferase/sulfurtransferase
LDNSNAQDILKGSNVIVDGLDSFLTRHAVNRASVTLKIPYIYAGAIEYQSNLSTFVPGDSGCLYCLAGNAKDDPARTCATVGVSPDLLYITASVEVREALLIVLGRQPLLKGRVMTIDITSLDFDFFDIGRMDDCPVCTVSSTRYPIESKGPSVTVLCSGAFSIAPPKHMTVDTNAVFEHLEKTYQVKKIGKALQIKTSTEAQITLMASGIAIIKGIENSEDALMLYNEILEDEF